METLFAGMFYLDEGLHGGHRVLVLVLDELCEDIMPLVLVESGQVLEQWNALVHIPGPRPAPAHLGLGRARQET